jgi:hypothetical protein
MKLVYLGAAIAAGAAILFRRSRAHQQSSGLKRAARIAAAAILGRHLFVNIFKRVVKQNFQLRACNMRLHRMENQMKVQPQ